MYHPPIGHAVPKLDLRNSLSLKEWPGLVVLWDFQALGERVHAAAGADYTLIEGAGRIEQVEDSDAPFGKRAALVQEGQWWKIPREDCPGLNFHGSEGRFTLVAWIKRMATASRHCEFLAGQWNETSRGRQYGLFLNIRVWNSEDQVCGHVSNNGGATPGFDYCIDGAFSSSPVPMNEWCCVGMSYDGVNARAWWNGVSEFSPTLNPYQLEGGLHDGGANGSDFTVGAVDRSGEMGNFFYGLIGGLAVFRRALTAAEMYALAHFSEVVRS